MAASETQVLLPSSIPLQRGDDGWVSGRAATALVVLVALLGAAWLVVRKARSQRVGTRLRLPARRERALLRVVTSQRLSSHSALHVVDYDGRRLLIADGAQGVRCLRDEPRVDAVAQPGGPDDAH